MVETEGPLVAVNKTGVVKNCSACFFNDRESPFNRRAPHRLSSEWFAILILRTNFAKRKSAQVIRASKVKPLEDRYVIPVSPLAHGGHFAVNYQDCIPRKVKILRCFEVQSVDLSVTSKKAACDIRRKADASSPA